MRILHPAPFASVVAVALFAACSSQVQVSTGGSGGSPTTGSSSSGTTIGDTTSSSNGSSSSSSSSGSGGMPVTGPVKKVDLLLEVDNSRSMADKQIVLAEVLPDLVRELVNPPCYDPSTGMPSPNQPAGPSDACPDAGTKRVRQPVADIHVGVITTSIGGHGADSCPESETYSCPAGATNTTNDDHGHLVTRLAPCSGGAVNTYQNKGFLAWDPNAQLNPPGESNVGAVSVDVTTGTVITTAPGLVPSLKDMVLGAGQLGCGYEATLESWYRFLADPTPYQTITVDPNTLKAQPMGIDDVLLQQRADFLRSDSLLAIVMLTDENDCSTKEYGQFWLAGQQRDPSNPNKNFYLPKPRHECATNPNDPCCRSCGQDQSGCPADPNCTGSLDAKTDDVNLRCWDQKRRFGIDFLYPIDRYVTALTQPNVPDRDGNYVPNPIFSVLDPTANTGVRDPSLVYLAAVAGVPWQDIARDPTDLKKGYKNTAQLAAVDGSGHSTWDYIIGDPANHVPPLDPHMIESWAPRMGTNPITGDTLALPAQTEGGPDQLNGHEYTPGTKNGVQVVADDLEYACIFKLPAPRDCSDPTVASCDCTDPMNDNPLCAVNGTKGRTLQTHAKAYPGIRELTLLKSLGGQGVVGSICPRQTEDLTAADFAYRPFVSALMEGIGGHLP